MNIVGGFGFNKGLRGYAATHATNCDALCILTPFYQNQHEHFVPMSVFIGPHGPAFVPHVQF